MSGGLTRSSLTRFAGSMADPDPGGARKFAQKVWKDHGAIVIFPDQLKAMGGLERQLFEAVAAKHYGTRK